MGLYKIICVTGALSKIPQFNNSKRSEILTALGTVFRNARDWDGYRGQRNKENTPLTQSTPNIVAVNLTGAVETTHELDFMEVGKLQSLM